MADTATIRSLNDRFRKGDTSVPGQTVMTQGVSELLQTNKVSPLAITQIVQEFDDFTEDNDPHTEHDFGAFQFLKHKCFWKLDYYDPTLKWGSEDPADISKTHRVLTIMLASEY